MKFLFTILLLLLQSFSTGTFAFSCIDTKNCYALIINNSSYPTLGQPLKNTKQDGPGMKKTLKSKGFFVKNVQNVNLKRFEQEVDKLIHTVPSGTPVVLIYFSGHGMIAEQERYYIPINAEINNVDKNKELFSLRKLVKKLEKIENKAEKIILIMDACANEGGSEKGTVKSVPGTYFKTGGEKGIIVPEYPPNVVALFAARPTDVARDSFAKEQAGIDVQHCISDEMKIKYSLYTSQLIDFINQETLPFSQLISDISKKVDEISEEYLICVKKELKKYGKDKELTPPQSAWVEGNVGILSNFYFSPPTPNQPIWY
jgi:hypothetical protein